MEREVIMRFNGFSRDRNAPILEHVADLVRCKDCKWRLTYSCPMTNVYLDNTNYWLYSGDLDFCSYGEKKEERIGDETD